MKNKKFHIFGDGLYAATLTKLLRDAGCDVTNYRLPGRVGGSMASTFDNNFDMPIYGPHYFHTDNQDVVKILNSVCEFIDAEEDTKTCIKLHNSYKLINGDLNHKSIIEAFDLKIKSKSTFDYITRLSQSYDLTGLSEQEVALLRMYGAPLYHACIKSQTEKTWNRPISEVPMKIINRVKLSDSLSDYKYHRTYNLYPKRGWCSYFNNILYNTITLSGKDALHPVLNDLFRDDKNVVVWSLPITILERNCKVKYISRNIERVSDEEYSFLKQTIPDLFKYCSIYAAYDPEVIRYLIPENTPANRYWHPEGFENPTVFKEIFKMAEEDDLFMYLDPSPENAKEFKRLRDDVVATYPKIVFGGRLGKGNYVNMDGIVESCIDQFELWK